MFASVQPGRATVWIHAFVAAWLALIASCSLDGDKPYAPKPGTAYDSETRLPLEIISTKDRTEMVLVRAGTFRRGDPDRIAVPVAVKAFYIDKYEVTNERYHRFTSAARWPGPSMPSEDAVLLRWDNGSYPAGRGPYPVVLVSVKDAGAFAEWAGKRLPAQEQWEYAARGPSSRQYPWGEKSIPPDQCNTADRLAGRELASAEMWDEWHSSWIQRKPAERNAEALKPVGSFPKDCSPFGCFDLAGGVREWCVKRAGNGYSNGFNNPGETDVDAIASNAYVVCGGSWLTQASAARAWRYELVEPSLYYDVGFRCVVPAEDPAIQALAKPVSK